MNPLNFEVKGRFDDFIAKTFVFILRVLFEFFKIINMKNLSILMDADFHLIDIYMT